MQTTVPFKPTNLSNVIETYKTINRFESKPKYIFSYLKILHFKKILSLEWEILRFNDVNTTISRWHKDFNNRIFTPFTGSVLLPLAYCLCVPLIIHDTYKRENSEWDNLEHEEHFYYLLGVGINFYRPPYYYVDIPKYFIFRDSNFYLQLGHFYLKNARCMCTNKNRRSRRIKAWQTSDCSMSFIFAYFKKCQDSSMFYLLEHHNTIHRYIEDHVFSSILKRFNTHITYKKGLKTDNTYSPLKLQTLSFLRVHYVIEKNTGIQCLFKTHKIINYFINEVEFWK